MKIGLIYNVKNDEAKQVLDMEAEFDSHDTVEAIAKAIRNLGYEVLYFEANDTLFSKLSSYPIDLAFNIAEGMGGRGREAIVPAILEYLKIPYTGSDTTTLAIALDKTLTKRLISTYHLRVARSIMAKSGKLSKTINLRYPVIVKPNAEGSSKGIDNHSVVENEAELRTLVSKNYAIYQSDLICEEYIEGKEFTVGILGNGNNVEVLEPMEIVFKTNIKLQHNIYSYQVKQDCNRYLEYVCPAVIDEHLKAGLQDNAKVVYRALGIKDFARIDFIVSKSNRIYFLEVNPLPGLAPDYSDIVLIAQACGISHQELIQKIIDNAKERYGIKNRK